MSVSELKRAFKRGAIEKSAYIAAMLAHHEALFEYADFIKDTEIRRIEIGDDGIVFTLRNIPFTIRCPASQARVAPIEILNFDRYEPDEAAAVQGVLGSCRTILDVGANIGWFSLWFAHFAPTAQIHAFEPAPESYRFLAQNITANWLEPRILAHEFGLSERSGTFDLHSYPTGSTNASLANVAQAQAATTVAVRVATLDDWARESGAVPDFIKCDVEGAELLVFKGGEHIITRDQPIIFTEMLRKWSKAFGYHPNDAIAFLGRLGYQCHAIGPKGLTRFDHMTDESLETNFLFLHRERHRSIADRVAN
jgi:FkbM family methyltransferase